MKLFDNDFNWQIIKRTKKIFLSVLVLLFSLTNFAQTFTSNLIINIPDAPAPEVYDSVFVSGLATSLSSTYGLAGVCFNIKHTFDRDLILRLISPQGDTIIIANRVGDARDNFTATCIAQNGVNGYLSDGYPPFTGTWIPLKSLNLFNNGQNANGWWKFAMRDVGNGDIGLINLFSLTFSANPPAMVYPAIHTGRPRIYAGSARITWLQNNITIPGDCQNTYNDFLYAYQNWWINDPQLYLLGSDSMLWTWDWSSQWSSAEAYYTVFIYKLTNDPLALKRCRFLAKQVISCIDTSNFATMDWYEKENLLRQMSDAGDILLDWCYDNLPGSLRDQLSLSLYKMNREFMNTYILSSAGNSYVSSHNTWNTIFCNQNTLTLYNASGLTASQKDTVMQWYQTVYDKLINRFIPCWAYYRDDDGGWNWGAAYAMWSLVDQFQLFENMRVGTDKNFYTDLPWVQNSINQYVYFMQPNNKTIHFGDGETGLSGDRVMYLHARIFNDPRSLWLSQYWSQPAYTPNTNHKFAKLLYKDFTMATVSMPNSPLNWWTDKVGLSVSRSSWKTDATMITFVNSPSKRAAHEHRDNNSFTVFKNAPLLIDAGYYDTYGGTHYLNYYQRSIAHNTICVFDSTEIYSNFGQAASNDGGQIESNALMNYNDIFQPVNQRGQWIKYASGTSYEYNIADAQRSYDSTKLDFFRRRVLYVKPNRVIVLDHVHLKNRSTKQRDIKWVAHFVNKPTVNGSIINTKVSGHIETFNGKDYLASNKNGKIAIRTLLPSNAATTRIGGSGYEYWVNGVNYPPLSNPDTSFYSPGSWRIEVKPTTITDTMVFLHTIDVGDSTNNLVAGGISIQNNISIGSDWNDTLYFFSADADTGKYDHVFHQVKGGRTVGIFALDLVAGNYFVKVDGAIVATTATDNNGVLLSTATLPAGNHTVEIVQNNTSISDIYKDVPLQVYPNPAFAELNIILTSGMQLNEIQIYNSIGQLMMKTRYTQRINISSLAPGVYVLKVTLDGNYFTTKFIKG